MKKPNYLSIEFPRGKSTIGLAVKRYFKRLEGKILKINFGQKRSRKYFEYKILSAGLKNRTDWWGEEKRTFFKIEIEQIKEA